MNTTTIEASKKKITDSQHKSLDKGIHTGKTLKGKIDQSQKLHTLWRVATIKKIIVKPFKDIGLTVLYFKKTQEAAFQNRNILSDFNGN